MARAIGMGMYLRTQGFTAYTRMMLTRMARPKKPPAACMAVLQHNR